MVPGFHRVLRDIERWRRRKRDIEIQSDAWVDRGNKDTNSWIRRS